LLLCAKATKSAFAKLPEATNGPTSKAGVPMNVATSAEGKASISELSSTLDAPESLIRVRSFRLVFTHHSGGNQFYGRKANSTLAHSLQMLFCGGGRIDLAEAVCALEVAHYLRYKCVKILL
jgi:hypothetical protein